MTVVLVPESAKQMGVSMKLQGQEYWFSYLEKKVTDAEITPEKRQEWEEKYDGYEMIWSFTNPFIQPVDGQIDAACMGGFKQDFSADYSGGGFCCGIKYIGSFSPQPELWAIWAGTEAFSGHTAAKGFDTGLVSDIANWNVNSTSFTVQWEVSRWLPKQERDKAFYKDEYRFVAGDAISAWTFVNQTDTKYTLTYVNEVTL